MYPVKVLFLMTSYGAAPTNKNKSVRIGTSYKLEYTITRLIGWKQVL